MAKWHIETLRKGLISSHWNILDESFPDDNKSTGAWKIIRGNSQLIILFEGYDEVNTYSFDKSFGCHLSTDNSIALYLPKNKPKPSKPNAKLSWKKELQMFLNELAKEGNIVPEYKDTHNFIS